MADISDIATWRPILLYLVCAIGKASRVQFLTFMSGRQRRFESFGTHKGWFESSSFVEVWREEVRFESVISLWQAKDVTVGKTT